MARSSLFSPNVPNVIIDDRRVASGRERGSRVALPHPRNSSMTLKLSPLPTSSSIYSQRNCIMRMKTTTSRIAMNGPTNDFNMNWSSFFILYLVAASIILARASLRPSVFFPPAVANPGCPPPPPMMSLAASRTSAPAL